MMALNRDAPLFTFPLVGRVDARSASGWGSFTDVMIDPHSQPLPTRGRGEERDRP
jgi:hypothetical protein